MKMKAVQDKRRVGEFEMRVRTLENRNKVSDQMTVELEGRLDMAMSENANAQVEVNALRVSWDQAQREVEVVKGENRSETHLVSQRLGGLTMSRPYSS